MDIEGYQFKHIPTNTNGMYIKLCHNFEEKQNLSKSIDDVSESLFIELKKMGVFTCITYPYQHLLMPFLKMRWSMWLNNVDLVNYATETNTWKFYNPVYPQLWASNFTANQGYLEDSNPHW